MKTNREGSAWLVDKQVTVAITSYKIEQKEDEGKLTLELFFDNPDGDCNAYAIFLDEFVAFVQKMGVAPPSLKS